MKVVKTDDIKDRKKRGELKKRLKESSKPPRDDKKLQAVISALNSLKSYVEDNQRMNLAILRTLEIIAKEVKEKQADIPGDKKEWDKIQINITKRNDQGDLKTVIMEKV